MKVALDPDFAARVRLRGDTTVFVIAAGAAAALGAALQIGVFNPLVASPTQAIMIASIGVSITLQEGLRMQSGGREQWLSPIFADPLVSIDFDGFVVHVSFMQFIILAVAGLLLSSLVLVLARSPADLPTMLNYNTHAKERSLYNTPPCFAIYVMRLVVRWILDQGGLQSIARHNEEKAALLYDAIDSSDFYRPHAAADSRSLHDRYVGPWVCGVDPRAAR